MIRALSRLAAASVLVLSTVRPSTASGPAPVGAAFKLSNCPNCQQLNPRIAGTPSGKLVAAYDIRPLGASPRIVQGRIFPGTGAAAAPFSAQIALSPAQYDAAVASIPTGAFVIAWSTVDPLTRNSDVWAQRYDATGKPAGAIVPVNVDPVGVP